MSVLTEGTALVRLRGSLVHLDIKIDSTEMMLRRERSIEISDRDTRTLGELLRIPTLSYRLIEDLPATAREILTHRPNFFEFPDEQSVRRIISPIAHVEMVTLPTKRWRQGLQEVSRFSPYSSRKLIMDSEPHDVDILCMEAAYWGVGVQIGERLLVKPELFLPTRYSGASWLFAEQAARAVGLTSRHANP